VFLDESAWRGKIYSAGWRPAMGGDAPVAEPATGAELRRTGLASAADVAAAGRHVGQLAGQHLKRCHLELGGIAASGTGARFGGTANLDAFTDTRWVTLRGEIATYPF
jgi:hypothetical protein